MAYLEIPVVEPGTPGADRALRALLGDLAERKEFRVHADSAARAASRPWAGFGAERGAPALAGLRLDGAQLFVSEFDNPDTPYPRLFIKWQTGTGKSIAAIGLGNEFVRRAIARGLAGARVPAVFVLGFTVRETIQEDMIHFPEFGFVSAAEVDELRRLRAAQAAAGAASAEARQYAALTGSLRRRTTDRARGGYYQFYGYREFANRLFTVTRQGVAAGFDLQALFARSQGEDEADFGQQLRAAVRRGDLLVDEDLLEELREGMLIADEVHDTYSVRERNNYGIAIQYVLDALGDAAPRAVFMSATPVGGSAAEAVDVLNLLVPRSHLPGGLPLRRADFFTQAATQADEDDNEDTGAGGDQEAAPAAVSQLREGALERMAHLAAGRVSFLLDSDVGRYPRRVLVGDEVAGVPYLRLTLCPMSPFHERTLAHERERSGKPESAGLAAGAYTLFDIAFPNPDFADTDAPFGLYWSGETPARLAQAPDAWRAAAGVSVARGAAAGVLPGTAVISGAFLGRARLAAFSAKMTRVLDEVIAIVRGGPGKIMIYHHRVKMSGVLLYQEMLRENGFADETTPPTDTTLCGVCGLPRAEHSEASGAAPLSGIAMRAADHDYTPARFVVVHGDVDKAARARSMSRFGTPANLQGHLYRVIICSKIVRQGYNFRAVRHLLVTSLPTDFSTMIQVFGRPGRKGSHEELPPEAREVRIRVFVSVFAASPSASRRSPELQRYVDKGSEYLVIQEVERALFHRWAVDGFANYPRILTALRAGAQGYASEARDQAGQSGAGPPAATLEALPYAPVVEVAPSAVTTATFEAYGHGEREVAAVAAMCRALFAVRPVWTYADLWAAVRAGAVRRAGYDVSLIDEGNFALALAGLARPSLASLASVPGGGGPPPILRAGPYYVAAPPDGRLDVESYLRGSDRAPPQVSVNIASYLRAARSGENFTVRLREFEDLYLRPGAPSTPELSLVEYSAAFHYALIRQLIVARQESAVTCDDDRLRTLYRRFRVMVVDTSTKPPRHGYVTAEAVSLYEAGQWRSAPHADFGIGRRHRENDIVVGFVVATGAPAAADTFAVENVRARFKLRLPIQKLRGAARTDARADGRTLARGAVCETRSREELEAYVRRLRAAVASAGAGGTLGGVATLPAFTANLSYAAQYDKAAHKRFPSAGELCSAIRLQLLALEEHARAPANGMVSGLRWVYLFSERPPSVAALLGRS